MTELGGTCQVMLWCWGLQTAHHSERISDSFNIPADAYALSDVTQVWRGEQPRLVATVPEDALNQRTG